MWSCQAHEGFQPFNEAEMSFSAFPIKNLRKINDLFSCGSLFKDAPQMMGLNFYIFLYSSHLNWTCESVNVSGGWWFSPAASYLLTFILQQLNVGGNGQHSQTVTVTQIDVYLGLCGSVMSRRHLTCCSMISVRRIREKILCCWANG